MGPWRVSSVVPPPSSDDQAGSMCGADTRAGGCEVSSRSSVSHHLQLADGEMPGISSSYFGPWLTAGN